VGKSRATGLEGLLTAHIRENKKRTRDGIGREGPRYAIREMTDERLIVFNM
jgi:hypothetical protein